MRRNRSALARGAIAGALAATAVILFFVVVDALAGNLLRTPMFLAGLVFGADAAGPGVVGIALYTVVHYVVFMALGVGLASLMERTGVRAWLLSGLVLGFLLFDVAFYLSVGVSGVNVVERLGWPTFLAGNLIAGLVLMGYLRRTGPSPERGWAALLREHRVVRDGLYAGVIGAAAVAVWFLILDFAMGRPLFTPAALGSVLLTGAEGVQAVQVSAGVVAAYSVVHVAAFLVTGLVFAALVNSAEDHPQALLALALLFVTFETFALAGLAILAAWLLEVIPWWTILVANLVAAAAMGFYLWQSHPGVARDWEEAEQRTKEADQPGGGHARAAHR